jgi:PAS domain S-box-containing protein
MSAQLFYFPIFYATYFYPRKGLFVAGFSAVAYEILAYFYVFPDTGSLVFASGQAILFICIAAAITYFTEKINTSEARYRSIFETSLLGIVLFDENNFLIRLANTRFERMLGYSTGELIGTPFSGFFLTREEQRRFFEYFGSNEEITNFETSLATKDHELVWVNLSWRRINSNLVSCSVIDINQRKIAERIAEEHFTQYKQVTESSPTGILTIREGKIVYANPAFGRFSGYSPDELSGKEIATLIHPDDQAEFTQSCEETGSGVNPPGKAEYRFRTKSGETRLGTLFFTQIVQKGSPAILIDLVDITEREELKQQIVNDDERHRGIISSVANELSTPLQPIIDHLNKLTQDPKTYGVTDETRTILDRVAKSVDRERQIINQMLELSVLDSGKIQLNYTVFLVSSMVKSIIDSRGYLAKAEITTDIPPDLVFEADEDRISIVIDSMLSNAVMYSKPPRRIRISYQSTVQDKMHRLAIQDNGIGITGAQLDEIFQPVQLPESGTTDWKYDRIGLSLSIAKKYIQLHGGYISVDSVVNLGSTFTIHIPKQKAIEKKPVPI